MYNLKEKLANKKCLRFIEVHNYLSYSAIRAATVKNKNSELITYDGMWSSSLTDSTAVGLPDTEIFPLSVRIRQAQNILSISDLPMIMDADTGGHQEHFAINVFNMSKSGISAVIIEDKSGLKQNSLFGNNVFQQQATISEFCEKLSVGVKAKQNPNFLIIARIESLILEKGMEDAMTRAIAYVNAGADGIMIHSRSKQPNEVIEFAEIFRKKFPYVLLVCVPTTYNDIYFSDLEVAGFNIVIYANHMLRAAHKAMQIVANNILQHGRSKESEVYCTNVNDILTLVQGNFITKG